MHIIGILYLKKMIILFFVPFVIKIKFLVRIETGLAYADLNSDHVN